MSYKNSSNVATPLGDHCFEINTTEELKLTNQNSGSTQRETVLPVEASDEVDMKFEYLSNTTSLKDIDLDPLVLVRLSAIKSAMLRLNISREVQLPHHSVVQHNRDDVQMFGTKVATLTAAEETTVNEEILVHKQPVAANGKYVMHNMQQTNKTHALRKMEKSGGISDPTQLKVLKLASSTENSGSSGIEHLNDSNNMTGIIFEGNQILSHLCKVCGDEASKHSYYGGRSCPSCRAFFRRRVKKLSRQVHTFIYT